MKKRDVDIIPAIPTTYKGIRFRSRLEATWAEWFDNWSIKWSYESEGFNLNGVWYLPDFYLPEISTIIEVKGALQGIRKARAFYDALMEINLNHVLTRKFDVAKLDKDKTTIAELLGGALSAVDWNPKYHYFLVGSPVPYFYNIQGYFDDRLFSCEKCGKYWIGPISQSFACRVCGAWEGDHYLASADELPMLAKPLEWDPPTENIGILTSLTNLYGIR